jgi:hypothetical protein
MGISTVFISSAFISGPNIGLLLTDAKVWIGRKANIQIDHKADLFMGRVTPLPPPPIH